MSYVDNKNFSNDRFIERLEKHESSDRNIKINKLEDINQSELKLRCMLSKKNYALAGRIKRLKIRTIAMNKKLTRWLL